MNQRKNQSIYQNSIRAPFLTYVILCLIFFMIESLAFHSSPVIYTSYSLIAPFILLMLIQQNLPFFYVPITGFLLSSLLQSIIHPNSRYVIGNGMLGAVVWSVTYLFSKWIARQLKPIEVIQTPTLPKQTINTEDISVSDILMDRAHIGYYLTLDTVIGPGLSTRRGYTTFGGGPECLAPPNTIMTFPDFIPQIPCKEKKDI